jgi:hypothetical protein
MRFILHGKGFKEVIRDDCKPSAGFVKNHFLFHTVHKKTIAVLPKYKNQITSTKLGMICYWKITGR